MRDVFELVPPLLKDRLRPWRNDLEVA